MIFPQIDSWQNTRVALGGNTATKSTSANTTQRSSIQSGTPLPVILANVTVTDSNGQKTVTVTYLRNPSDQSLQQVAFWVRGYLGNVSPTKITESVNSPVSFSLQATGETVSIIAQSVGKDGSILDLARCPSKGISL